MFDQLRAALDHAPDRAAAEAFLEEPDNPYFRLLDDLYGADYQLARLMDLSDLRKPVPMPRRRAMTTEAEIPGADEAWEEERLGADANFAAVANDVDQAAIDQALELQPISIRLQKSLIEDYKLIAQLNGVGYQPLMGRVLARFAEAEKKRVLREVATEARERQQLGEAAGGDERSGISG